MSQQTRNNLLLINYQFVTNCMQQIKHTPLIASYVTVDNDKEGVDIFFDVRTPAGWTVTGYCPHSLDWGSFKYSWLSLNRTQLMPSQGGVEIIKFSESKTKVDWNPKIANKRWLESIELILLIEVFDIYNEKRFFLFDFSASQQNVFGHQVKIREKLINDDENDIYWEVEVFPDWFFNFINDNHHAPKLFKTKLPYLTTHRETVNESDSYEPVYLNNFHQSCARSPCLQAWGGIAPGVSLY